MHISSTSTSKPLLETTLYWSRFLCVTWWAHYSIPTYLPDLSSLNIIHVSQVCQLIQDIAFTGRDLNTCVVLGEQSYHSYPHPPIYLVPTSTNQLTFRHLLHKSRPQYLCSTWWPILQFLSPPIYLTATSTNQLILRHLLYKSRPQYLCSTWWAILQFLSPPIHLPEPYIH